MENQPKTLIIGRFDKTLLKEKPWPFDIEIAGPTEKEIQRQLQTANAIIIRSQTKITTDFLKLCPHLELIITATSGFDHIDLDATRKSNIATAHTPNAHIASTAELTLLLLHCFFKKIFQATKQIHSAHWDRSQLIGSELEGKKIGVVGMGRIGQHVARILKAYGCQIQYHDPYVNGENLNYTRYSQLDDLLRNSDVVTLHVPLTQETHHMINKNNLIKMPPRCLLINACRGSTVHEGHLVEALQKKIIAGACLDVFEQEPLPLGHPLLHCDNVILSPHLGVTTNEALRKSSLESLNKVEAHFNNESLDDLLPPDRQWYRRHSSSIAHCDIA